MKACLLCTERTGRARTMVQENAGLTEETFRTLLGQLWYHYMRGEKDRAAGFLTLLEACLDDAQIDAMSVLLDEKVYEELAARATGVSSRFQMLRLDANNLTLVRVVYDSDGQTLHLEPCVGFVVEQLSGLEVLLAQADAALTQGTLGAEERREQHKRESAGVTGWNRLPRLSPATAVGASPTASASDVTSREDARPAEESLLPALLDQLDTAFAVQSIPALCLVDCLVDLEPAEAEVVRERYPQEWLEIVMEATEEDTTEVRVLRRGEVARPWLHLTDCTFNRQGHLTGYIDDSLYVSDLAEMAVYLEDCRRALQLPIVDAFDFNPRA